MPSRPISPELLVSDHLSLSEPALSPDGSTFVFTLPCGGARQLFTMPAGGGLPRQITMAMHGHSKPAWAPDGRRIAAVAKGGVWTLAPDGTDLRCVTRHAAGDDHPFWTRDGRGIVFNSRRRGWPQWWRIPSDGQGPAACLTPPALEFLEGISWGAVFKPTLSPDGMRIACHARSRENLQRCEVWIFPTDGSGEGNCITPPGEIWEQDAVWSPDGRHLYLVSETPEDGWQRLCRVEAARPAGPREPLTQGPREDLPIHFSRDGKQCAYLRVVECAHELYAGPAGEKARRVNDAPAFFSIVDFAPDGRSLYVLRQSPVEMPHLARIELQSGRCEALTDNHLPGRSADELVSPSHVRYTNREGHPIEAFLWTPKEVSEGAAKTAPLLLSLHGGPHQFVRYDWNLGHQSLASYGYGVLAMDYRGSRGHGRAHRRGHYGRWGDADVIDILDGARWAAENLPWVERDRIGVMGGSYGGYLVYCCVTEAPDTFRCALASSGDSEIYLSYEHGDRPGRIDLLQTMGDPEKNRALYRKASPLYKVEDIRTPLMISHSMQDRSVVPLMGELIVEALRGQSKVHDAKLYENPDHGGIGHGSSTRENSLDAARRRLKFLNLHLKGDGSLKDEA